eukprot:1161838-Pelagomonas_calceolata.AAC.2
MYLGCQECPSLGGMNPNLRAMKKQFWKRLPFLLRNALDEVHAQSASVHSPLGLHVSTCGCAQEPKLHAAAMPAANHACYTVQIS